MSSRPTREELQLRMDEAALNYARTHDSKYEAKVWRPNDRLAELRRIAMLEDAVARPYRGHADT
jgi:hypothetical protein